MSRLLSDLVTVFDWNPHLYRRVAATGFVLGFFSATLIAGAVWSFMWLAGK